MTTREISTGVWPLLRRNVSTGQWLGYAVANLVGLSIILAAVLFYMDGTTTGSGGDTDAYITDHHVVLSKRVTGIGFTPTAFTPDEIADLEARPWVNSIGRFTASQFTVHAFVDLGGRGFSSTLFFESIPDRYFDIKPDGWGFDPASRFVPVILCKDYLALYNFGFALPQGLPQLSEEAIGIVPITLKISGPGHEAEYFEARIVGFSSRLNTIAVPQAFMDWANARFAPGSGTEASRIIAEVHSFDSPEMLAYLQERGIELSGDKADATRLAAFVGIAMSVVAAVGGLICLLALAILLLSIHLLLLKSRSTLHTLMLLGYSPRSIGRYYVTATAVLNAVVGAGGILLVCCLRGLWAGALQELGAGGATIWPVFVIAIAFAALVTGIDAAVIRRELAAVWRS